MATHTITETLTLPGGVAPSGVKVRLRLVAADTGRAVGYATAAGVSVVGDRTVVPRKDGYYEFTGVNPNSAGVSDDVIDVPTGTVYELVVTMPASMGTYATRYVNVPDAASTQTYQVSEILSTLPSDLASFAGDTIHALAAGVDDDGTAELPSWQSSATVKVTAPNLLSRYKWRVPAVAATTANITLSGAQTIDGVSVVAGDRVLVKSQTAPAENGVYLVASGAWTRATDADSGSELVGAVVFVVGGTVNGGRLFAQTTTGTIVVGTTGVVWARVDAGALAAANNLSDLASATTARANLGVGLVDDDAGATVASTNSATTLFASPIQIPANPVAGDVFVFEASGSCINIEGSSRTITFAHTVGGTAAFTSVAASIANGTVAKLWQVRTTIRVTTAGASGALFVVSRIIIDGDNVQTIAYDRFGGWAPTGVDLTAACTIALTAQPSVSSANLSCTCASATLEKLKKAF